MASAVVFEITHPGWQELPDYQDDGAAGQVITFCEACGYGDFLHLLEAAEEANNSTMRDAEGDQYAFLRHRAVNGLTWKEYLRRSEPTLDSSGLVCGAWGECITAAVIFEKQNPDWSQLPLYMEDGPAGQVLMYLNECGHEVHEQALSQTETLTHDALADGNRVPVFEDIYQAVVGTQPAEHVNEEPPEMTGRKKAFLVGVNYPGQKAELRGCVNDVHTWSEVLTSMYGFEENDMLKLTDDQSDPRKQPTLANIRSGLRWLVAGAQPGDVLFWQYSGHGAQKASKSQNEADGMDEVLCPTDYCQAGYLVDDEIFDTVVVPLESGVKLTIILDCCHSGTAVDLPFIWNEGGSWEEVGGTAYTAGDVQMFSGCEDDQCSMDASRHGRFGGAMTCSLTEAIKEGVDRSYPELLGRLREILVERGFEQVPRLSSSQSFDTDGRCFNICGSSVPNQNAVLGATGPPRLQPIRQGANIAECEGVECPTM